MEEYSPVHFGDSILYMRLLAHVYELEELASDVSGEELVELVEDEREIFRNLLNKDRAISVVQYSVLCELLSNLIKNQN